MWPVLSHKERVKMEGPPKNHTEAGVTLPDPKASVHAEER